jgi:tRNA 2-thiouridine synthesizing protein A
MTTDASTDTTETLDEPARDEEGRLVVDARGMACPRPILELAAAMRDLPVGDVVLLLADDPAARVDVPAWARMKRQRVLALDDVDGVLHIVVAKRTEV